MTMSRRERRYRRRPAIPQAISAVESAVFLADADREYGGVQNGEDQRDLPQAEHKREHGDLTGYDQVIRVIDEAVRSAANQRRLGKDDDPRRPAWAKRGDHPDARELKQNENCEPGPMDRLSRGEPPQGSEPQHVHRNNQRIVRTSDFARAGLE